VRLLVDVLRVEHPRLRGLPGLAVETPEEAAAVALVAGGATVLHDLEDHRVAIAVDQDVLDVLVVARLLALAPQAARAAPVGGSAGAQRLAPGLLVDVGDHQDLAGRMILGDGGHQALAEIELHGTLPRC
jgi:hypothetical protein